MSPLPLKTRCDDLDSFRRKGIWIAIRWVNLDNLIFIENDRTLRHLQGTLRHLVIFVKVQCCAMHSATKLQHTHGVLGLEVSRHFLQVELSTFCINQELLRFSVALPRRHYSHFSPLDAIQSSEWSSLALFFSSSILPLSKQNICK